VITAVLLGAACAGLAKAGVGDAFEAAGNGGEVAPIYDAGVACADAAAVTIGVGSVGTAGADAVEVGKAAVVVTGPGMTGPDVVVGVGVAG